MFAALVLHQYYIVSTAYWKIIFSNKKRRMNILLFPNFLHTALVKVLSIRHRVSALHQYHYHNRTQNIMSVSPWLLVLHQQAMSEARWFYICYCCSSALSSINKRTSDYFDDPNLFLLYLFRKKKISFMYFNSIPYLSKMKPVFLLLAWDTPKTLQYLHWTVQSNLW